MNNTTALFPYDVKHFSEIERKPECLVCQDTDRKILLCFRDRFVAHASGGEAAHCFHKKCLAEWLNSPLGQGKCPLCDTAFDQDSVDQSLTPSLLEQGAQQLELASRSAIRSVYWGTWSWSAVQLLGNHTFHLDSFKRTLQGQVVLPFSIKAADKFLGNRAFLLASFLTGVAGYLFSPDQDSEEAFEEIIISVASTFFNIFSPGGINIVISFIEDSERNPEIERISSTWNHNLYRWSKKAIPLLIAGVAYRALDTLANSFSFPVP